MASGARPRHSCRIKLYADEGTVSPTFTGRADQPASAFLRHLIERLTEYAALFEAVEREEAEAAEYEALEGE